MRSLQARETVVDLFKAALQAVDPCKLVDACCESVASAYFREHCNKLYVVSAGKAAFAMTQGLLEKSVPDLVTRGIVVTKYGHARGALPEKIDVFEAGHPMPDQAGVDATAQVIKLLKDTDPQTLILCLISGGASALLVAPCEGVTLFDKQSVTDLLLKAGADIRELNTVRKHLSKIKGGGLASIAHPARILSLILSDVIGDPPDVIASGPTSPDETTFADALAVIDRYGLKNKIPATVTKILVEGAGGKIAETPKKGNPVFNRVETIIIGSNKTAVDAAAGKAAQWGFETIILSSEMQGEARDAGRWLAQKALALKKCKGDGKRICLLSGGETTVTVTGSGIGGRNMEMALAFAEEIAGEEGITFLSAGTDGTDGPTDAAGAMVDGYTVNNAKSRGISSGHFLANNDSYTFFKETGELLVTGPTGTNVMDIQIAFLY